MMPMAERGSHGDCASHGPLFTQIGGVMSDF